MSIDFSGICRICLESNKFTYDIYTSHNIKLNTTYSEMLIRCTKLTPFQGDGLPHLICKECKRQLKRVYTFNIQCEESDKLLKNLQNTHSHVKDDVPDNLIKNESKETTLNDIKNEDETNIPTTQLNNKDIKEEVKFEPNYNDEDNSCWEAFDDNVFLSTINTQKKSDLICDDNEGDGVWDADDDNVLLKEVKRKKIIKGEAISENKPRKKRVKRKKDEEAQTVPESKLPHQCDICGKFLSNKSNLMQHKICHTDLRPYKCPDCPAAFRGYSALFQHKKVHSGETPYHCEYCPKQFRRRTGLVNHIRMHTGEKLYSCEICFKNFVQSAQLSIHMKRHKGDKPFLCQECGKGFPIKADLKVHQRIHNGEKPYSCHLCTKTFATSGNLSIHVRIHKKEVRYHCSECQRGFVTCSAYNVHLKRHKGQRDYQCDCGKTFFTSSALKQHKVVHTGEKKYQCKICERKFSQTSHLNRHFKRDHGKPNAPLPAADQYKLVLPQEKNIFELFEVPKVPSSLNTGVKCEGS